MAERWAHEALAAAAPKVFWTDNTDGPDPAPVLTADTTADLAIVGAGFTGLWAALLAAEADPGRRIVVIEAATTGFGASSRNGGFCDASLTHGLRNGLEHWPEETPTLLRLGAENFAGLAATVEEGGIDARLEQTGTLSVATEPWHLADLEEAMPVHRQHGEEVELLDGPATRAILDSPTYVGGMRHHDGAIVDPARLAWGLRRLAESRGVELFEQSPVGGIEAEGSGLRVLTGDGTVSAARVVMATNAYRGPVARPRRYIVPVYDYVLMTEPLSVDQQASIGWAGREGVGDSSNQFHYYRPTADGRILWGGYDAIYHYNNRVDPALDQRDATQTMLAEHFFTAFPQLEGLRFSHRWGGPIATTTRFTATWGTAHGGRLAWAGGYTGLGVAASRFGAAVALDLVDGRRTDRTELTMVQRHPFPFPPEPLRWLGVELTRRAIRRADRRQGRRGPWLRLLDRFGIGFDS